MVEVCNFCDCEVAHVGDDALSFCQDHGIVEGETHEIEVEEYVV